ncbi:AAA family ATPase, partial [Lentzea indica]
MMRDAEHLIDREREKESIEGLLTAAVSGTGSLLTVCGAAGTGKTALIDHATDLATTRDMTVLRVRGSFAEVDAPFGLAQRLFEPRLELGALSREGLNEALTGLAAAGTVLVAVDDVQWADEPSLRWLASLPPRIEHHGIAMLVSVCAGDPPTDSELLDDLLESSADELRPCELGPAAAAALLGGDPDRASTCWELTAGNPALLTRLAAELSTEDTDPLQVEVPLVARTVHVWLRRVSDRAVAIARAVAVLGSHATLDRVADITGVELPEVADVVAAVERKGLLRTADGMVDFAQPLVRVTVTRELSFAALRRVHGQAARLLHESGAPDESIAEHLLASGPVTSEWAVGVLRSAAASALERGCPELAVTWLRHAAAG